MKRAKSGRPLFSLNLFKLPDFFDVDFLLCLKARFFFNRPLLQSCLRGEVRESYFLDSTVPKVKFLKKVGLNVETGSSNVLCKKQFRSVLFIAVIRSSPAGAIAEI